MPEDKRHTTQGLELQDEMILAAIERAELHSTRPPGVLFSTIKEHLGLPPGSGSGRVLRPKVRGLVEAKLVRHFKRNGCEVWTLTSRGQSRVAAARQAEQLGELPEAPQHRAWREAQSLASEQLAEFRDELSDALEEGKSLLFAPERSSEAWFLLGKRLEEACSRIGTAMHCLYEWAEPTDAAADVDEDYRRGRRNMWRWQTR